MQRKIEKRFFVFYIFALKLVAVHSPYYEENTCDRQSMCSQTDLRFQISKRKTFSNLIFLKQKMRKYDQSAVLQISAVFGTL